MGRGVERLRHSGRLRVFSWAYAVTLTSLPSGLAAAAAAIALDRYHFEGAVTVAVSIAAALLLVSVASAIVASALQWNIPCNACGNPIFFPRRRGRRARARLAALVIDPLLGREISCAACGRTFITRESRPAA